MSWVKIILSQRDLKSPLYAIDRSFVPQPTMLLIVIFFFAFAESVSVDGGSVKRRFGGIQFRYRKRTRIRTAKGRCEFVTDIKKNEWSRSTNQITDSFFCVFLGPRLQRW